MASASRDGDGGGRRRRYKCSICNKEGHTKPRCPLNATQGRRKRHRAGVKQTAVAGTAPIRPTPHATPATVSAVGPVPPAASAPASTASGSYRGPALEGVTKCPPALYRRRGDRMRWGLPSTSWMSPRADQPPLEELPTELQHLMTNKQVVDAMLGDLFRHNTLAMVDQAQRVTGTVLARPAACFDALFSRPVYATLMHTMNAHLDAAGRARVTISELRVWMALFMLRCTNHQTTAWVLQHYDSAQTCGMDERHFLQLRRALRLLPPHVTLATEEVCATLRSAYLVLLTR